MRTQGVVVTLVVFMILASILGVTTYFGYKGLSEKKQQLAAAQQQTNDAKSLNSSMNSDFTSLKTKLGYEAVTDSKQLVEQMNADVEAALGQTEVNSTYKDAVVALGRNLASKNVEFVDYQRQLEEATATALSETNKTTQQKAEFDRQLSELSSEHTKGLNDAQASYDKLKDSYDTQTKDFERLTSDTKKAIADAKKETADYQESKDKFKAINDELSARVDELANATYERADAEIVYADQVLKIVRLNVGEKDGVRPLTTFNVFEPNTLDMDGAVAKGSVQVVRSIGEHLCEAKILTDEMSNPIESGDLVYTPLWRAGDVVRYALDFHLDINGDNFSDLDEIINLVQSSGGEIAAYIDDDGVVQGELSSDVFRVVVSEKSIVDVLAKDFSRDDATKAQMQKDEQKFLNDAKALNIQQISLTDFLAKIGYKETAEISRYREEGGVDLQENGVGRQVVSHGVTAPTYQKDPNIPPVSDGVTAPIFDKESQTAPVSTGKVSDYYFRKRANSNNH